MSLPAFTAENSLHLATTEYNAAGDGDDGSRTRRTVVPQLPLYVGRVCDCGVLDTLVGVVKSCDSLFCDPNSGRCHTEWAGYQSCSWLPDF
jgi:hypothetical protein